MSEEQLDAQALEFLRLQRDLLRDWKKKWKGAERAVEKLREQVAKCRSWPEVYHEARLLQANLYQVRKGSSQVVVQDWEQEGQERKIALDPHLDLPTQVEKRFKAARKFKAGIAPTQQALEKALATAEKFQKHLQTVEQATSLEELEPLKIPELPKKAVVSAEEALPYHAFRSQAGLSIWVGKSAKKNEQLTFTLAKGSDWWLHVSDYPGSHVIIKVPKNKEPDSETLQDAIQLAIGYSKAKEQGHADLVITQCKFVSRLGKSTGKVQISKHKIVHAKFDLKRFKGLNQIR